MEDVTTTFNSHKEPAKLKLLQVLLFLPVNIPARGAANPVLANRLSHNMPLLKNCVYERVRFQKSLFGQPQ